MASKKLFVGSLPPDITAEALRAEFSKYGHLEDVFVKPNCEPSRQFAFVTFAAPDQAQFAKDSTDRVLQFPGQDRPCDVMLAKNQGLTGPGGPGGGARPAPVLQGPRKIFVGSLPDGVQDYQLREHFAQYGEIEDIFIKQGCEPGRQWAFITYTGPAEAQLAKDSTDRSLIMPGADRACEVMLAKNQGKFGQESLAGGQSMLAIPHGHGPSGYGAQPPPPMSPPPAHLTPWRMYRTAAGLPYYHNETTGVTQWECPRELQVPGAGAYGNAHAYRQPAPTHYRPY